MHVAVPAAQPSDGIGISARGTVRPDPVACIHSATTVTAEELAALRPRLPAGARIVVAGPRTADIPTHAGDPIEFLDSANPLDIVASAARLFPGSHLLLIRADAELPPFACERLLRALAEPDVLAALPLDAQMRNPLPLGAPPLDTERVDALCFAYSDRRLLEDPFFPESIGAVSAWHGERLAQLGIDRWRDVDAIADQDLRIVLLDHLYVGQYNNTTPVGATPSPGQDDIAPPNVLESLRQRIADAIDSDAMPSCPGLDGKPVLLHVLHGWGGGAERWVRDFAAADSNAHHLVLIARGSFRRRRHGEWLELHDGTLSATPLRRWPLPRAIADTALGNSTYRDLLATVVRDYCVDAIVVSSLIGHSLDALRSGLPTFCVVHDHYPLWPTLHRDFGNPDLPFDDSQLVQDLADVGEDFEFANRDPRHWQKLRHATVAALRDAHATLIAPSRSALANQLRLAPELGDLPAHIIGHGIASWPDGAPRIPQPPARDRLRLVVTGRIRKGKGAELLLSALPALRECAEIWLLGAGSDAQMLFGESGVHVLLDYRRDDLPDLLARIRPDAALLLPTVAETFSYTLSELRSLGVPVIATRVGALAERIEDGVDGFLIEPRADAVVARIAALARDRQSLDAVRVRLEAHDTATSHAMVHRYGPILELPTVMPLRYPLAATDPSMLEEAVSAGALKAAGTRERTLVSDLAAVRAENERRGEWGHALDRELAAVHGELDDRTRWALALDSELQELKPRYEQMLGSTSWRLTAPLRSTNARLHGLRASVAFRTLRFRTLLGRVRGSLAQRGLAGTLARIAQEARGPDRARMRVVYAEPKADFTPFAVPCSDAPRVSIVVPVYNKIAYTAACLRSISEHAGDTPFEVIVVDDGSSDATPQRLSEINGIRPIRNPQNLGFIGSCNAGAAAARGDYLLFLNNDTVVTAGWLEALVGCLEETPQAGMVGAKLVYPDGRLQEAGGIVFNDGSGWNYGRFEDPDDARFNFRREVDYCSGAAILLRRDLFTRLGLFDTRYTPAYYEDTDLAFAVRAAGLKVFYEPAATVVHFEGITSGTDTAGGIKRYQVVNRDKFVDKWKDALARQPAPGTPITIAATHRAGKRVLIIDANTPTPDQDSGSLRMVNLMRVLGDLGCQVSFLPDNRLWVERYTSEMQRLGIEALYAPYAQDPVKLLRERGREFELIVLSRHYVAASYVGLARLYAPHAKLAFDTVDLHYLREQRAAELEGNAELVRVAAATRAQELKLIRECDVTLVVSPVEQELLARDAPGARVDVLSNVHEVHGCKARFGERRDLVFVGGFQHPPNTDAVHWFVAEVLPLVLAQLPELRFHVIGSKVPDAIRALANEHVVVHGFVEDIMPYMDGCRVSVAPLRYGAGVKGKVNMAMSCGLPVVATPIAVEGMHVVPGKDVLVAADTLAFAEEVIRLYRDEALWDTLSQRGLDNVERHFSFDSARAAVQRILE